MDTTKYIKHEDIMVSGTTLRVMAVGDGHHRLLSFYAGSVVWASLRIPSAPTLGRISEEDQALWYLRLTMDVRFNESNRLRECNRPGP